MVYAAHAPPRDPDDTAIRGNHLAHIAKTASTARQREIDMVAGLKSRW